LACFWQEEVVGICILFRWFWDGLERGREGNEVLICGYSGEGVR